MLREELFHPLFAHFPIALLSLTPFLFLPRFSNKEDIVKKSDLLFKTNLYLGLVFYLIVLFLGDLSLEIIKNSLSSLQAAYHHEDMAYYTLYIFIAVVASDTIYLNFKDKHWIKYITFILCLFGVYFLVLAAHSGATLVYDQGAGVIIKN
jgi:uncharacterized membrane protein